MNTQKSFYFHCWYLFYSVLVPPAELRRHPSGVEKYMDIWYSGGGTTLRTHVNPPRISLFSVADFIEQEIVNQSVFMFHVEIRIVWALIIHFHIHHSHFSNLFDSNSMIQKKNLSISVQESKSSLQLEPRFSYIFYTWNWFNKEKRGSQDLGKVTHKWSWSRYCRLES